MRVHPEFGTVSKRAVGLGCLVGGLLVGCAKLAPDGALSAGGAGSSGQSSAAAGSAGEPEALIPIRPERSLIESNPDALAYFTLERVLALATGEAGADVFRAYALSFAPRSVEPALPGPRCDDENAASNGLSSLNGFPLPCPAEAANLYWQLSPWKPLAATNRFDLAPVGGENCGEQHLSFFYDPSFSGQPEFPVRAYLGFAAVIANPAPERGLEGCRALVDFWASLGQSEYDAPDRRARAFELAFLGAPRATATGDMPSSRELSALLSAGFQPLIRPQHFGHFGRVQLLYQGAVGLWHFFEHALVSGKEGLVLRRPLTQSLPVSALLEEHPKREQCINELISSIPGLLNDDVNLMRLDVDPACFAATDVSRAPTLVDGLTATAGNELRLRLDDHLKHDYPESGMQGLTLAKRVGFAGTCSGCHILGDSPWTNDGIVAQVNCDLMQACAPSGPDATRRCYSRSPLLSAILIPHWASVLDDFLLRPGAYGPLPGGVASTTAIDGAPLPRQNP